MKKLWIVLGALVIIAATVVTSVLASGLLKTEEKETKESAVTQPTSLTDNKTEYVPPKDTENIITYSWWWPDSKTLSADLVDAVVYGEVVSVKDIEAPKNRNKNDYFCVVEMKVAKEYSGLKNAPQKDEVITFIAPFSSAAVFYDEIEIKPGSRYIAFLFEYSSENNSKGFEEITKYGLTNAHYLLLKAENDGTFAANQLLTITAVWEGIPEGYEASNDECFSLNDVEKAVDDILSLVK